MGLILKSRVWRFPTYHAPQTAKRGGSHTVVQVDGITAPLLEVALFIWDFGTFECRCDIPLRFQEPLLHYLNCGSLQRLYLGKLDPKRHPGDVVDVHYICAFECKP